MSKKNIKEIRGSGLRKMFGDVPVSFFRSMGSGLDTGTQLGLDRMVDNVYQRLMAGVKTAIESGMYDVGPYNPKSADSSTGNNTKNFGQKSHYDNVKTTVNIDTDQISKVAKNLSKKSTETGKDAESKSSSGISDKVSGSPTGSRIGKSYPSAPEKHDGKGKDPISDLWGDKSGSKSQEFSRKEPKFDLDDLPSTDPTTKQTSNKSGSQGKSISSISSSTADRPLAYGAGPYSVKSPNTNKNYGSDDYGKSTTVSKSASDSKSSSAKSNSDSTKSKGSEQKPTVSTSSTQSPPVKKTRKAPATEPASTAVPPVKKTRKAPASTVPPVASTVTTKPSTVSPQATSPVVSTQPTTTVAPTTQTAKNVMQPKQVATPVDPYSAPPGRTKKGMGTQGYPRNKFIMKHLESTQYDKLNMIFESIIDAMEDDAKESLPPLSKYIIDAVLNAVGGEKNIEKSQLNSIKSIASDIQNNYARTTKVDKKKIEQLSTIVVALMKDKESKSDKSDEKEDTKDTKPEETKIDPKKTLKELREYITKLSDKAKISNTENLDITTFKSKIYDVIKSVYNSSIDKRSKNKLEKMIENIDKKLKYNPNRVSYKYIEELNTSLQDVYYQIY